MDGKPLSLEGSLGPIGKIPGMGTVAVDLALKALGELNASVKGKVVDPALARKFDLAINVSRFSPRKIMDSLGRKFPASTSDPEALKRVSLDMHVSGDTASLIIKDGVMELDDSKINFSASLAEFERPKAKFEISLDRIDLDRYMPPASEEKSDQKGTSGSKAEKGKTDYSSMRRPVIEGSLKVGELKIKGARAENILLTVDARDGLFQVKPLKMNLYRGDLMIKAQYDVRSDLPLIAADITAERIQARPLLNDLAKKDFIEGTAKASVEVRSRGEDPAVIKQNLNGRGELVFADGAIVGIDLAGMLRNVKATFGLEKKSGEKPRTDFSELKVPFTIENGIAQTESTSIASPLLRVTARGKADLVKETLDFRVEPKLVGTLKGQGDTSERSGLMVPVLVTGTFSSPSFAPDLEGLLKEGLDKGLNDPSKLKEQLKDMIPQKGPEKPPEDMKLNLPFKR
jgi:AsmA protein